MVVVRCMFLVGLFTGLVAVACDSDDEDDIERTPKGRPVLWVEHRLLTERRATKSQVYQAFDLALDRAVDRLIADGASRDSVLAAVRAVSYFELHDHHVFPGGGGRWLYGIYREIDRSIGVGMHPQSKAVEGSGYPDAALPWTKIERPGWIYWGELRLDAAFPALRHELGHVVHGPGYEHKTAGVLCLECEK